jgi:hypothetical protein
LVQRNRQVLVAAVEVTDQQREHLFVRGAEQEIGATTVLQTKERVAVVVPAVRRLVRFAGQESGEVNFLGTDRVHLVAHDTLDVAVHFPPEGKPGVSARGGTADVAGTDEELVARNFGVGRVVAEGTQEQLGQTQHRWQGYRSHAERPEQTRSGTGTIHPDLSISQRAGQWPG